MLVTVPWRCACNSWLRRPQCPRPAVFGARLLLYGVFVTKMLLLTRESVPCGAVPVAGGILLATFAGIWSHLIAVVLPQLRPAMVLGFRSILCPDVW